MTEITQGSPLYLTTTRTLDVAGRLMSESYSGDPLDGIVVTKRFDELGRRTNLAVYIGGAGTNLVEQRFSDDGALWLARVASGTNTGTLRVGAQSWRCVWIRAPSFPRPDLTLFQPHPNGKRDTGLRGPPAGEPCLSAQSGSRAGFPRLKLQTA